jgi:hypothetical protein
MVLKENSSIGNRIEENGIMDANVIATNEELALVKSHPKRGVNASQDRDSLSVLTHRFRNALKRSVAGIIEAGQVLIEAKKTLQHGKFTDWVDRELRFGAPTKTGSREVNIRKGQMLRMLAEHEVISNASHWHALPPSIRTLYELTQIQPKQRLLKLIESGKIHAGTTREEAIAFQPKGKRLSKTEPRKLKREIATLVDVCILLGQSDCVLAYIRSLKQARTDLTVQVFDQAVRWAKPQLIKKAGDE